MAYRIDLSSCWAKVHQANRHRQTLKGKLGEFVWDEAPIFRDKTNRVGIVAKLDPKTTPEVHVVRIATIPDKLLALLAMEVGDAVHNLRTALDHLAWQLALERYAGRPPSKPEEVYFPIAESATKFKGLRTIAHFDPARTKRLRLLQPYNSPDGRVIRALHKLDIRDKHRLLIRFYLDVEGFTPFPARAHMVALFLERLQRRWRGIEVGTKIGYMGFDPTDPNFRAEMKSDLVPRVLLPRYGRPVEWLARAIVAVGKAIEAFE